MYYWIEGKHLGQHNVDVMGNNGLNIIKDDVVPQTMLPNLLHFEVCSSSVSE